jgi:dethiobiotin synthetase
MKKYFITGIGTDVGKSIAASIITEALEADYWKPIQAGDLESSDTLKVQQFVKNETTVYHQEAYRLKHPMSPHAAAERDGVEIKLQNIKLPVTQNHLVVEGAGGLLVPLNKKDTILDLITQLDCEVILVSRHYLGSINHTLMSVELLKSRNISIKGILFNGAENKDTEAIVKEMSGLDIIGRIEELKDINKEVINSIAQGLKRKLI